MASRLQHKWEDELSSDREDRLFTAIMSELVYRRKATKWPDRRCSCWWCIEEEVERDAQDVEEEF